MATTEEIPYEEQIKNQTKPPVKPKGMMDLAALAEENPPSPPVEKPPVEVEVPSVPPEQQTQENEEEIITDDLIGELEELEKEEPETVPTGGGKKPKSKELNFRALESRKKEVEAKLAEAEKIAKEREARIKELEEEFEKVAFEKSPKFQQKFLKPKTEAEEAATAFAESMDQDPSIVARALKLTGKERIEFIDDTFTSGAAVATFMGLIQKVESADGVLQKALADRKETETLLQGEEIKHEEQTREVVLQNFEAAADKISSRLSLFRTKEGDEEHNALVEARLDRARKIILGEASEQDILFAPFLAATAVEYIHKVRELTQELQKYKARIKEDTKSSPAIAGRKTSSTTSSGKPKGAMRSISDALAEM